MRAAKVSSVGATHPRNRQLHLADVLRQLSVPALGVFLDTLRINNDIKNTRLACLELRDVIDQNFREIKLGLHHGNLEDWETGVAPALSRWPLCNSVTLNLRDFGRAHAARIISTCFRCFESAPLQTRMRIKKMTLRLEPQPLGAQDDAEDEHMEPVVTALVSRLPALEELGLHKLHGMSYSPVAQHALFDSLASLRHLQRLTLPGNVLEYLGILAGNNSSGSNSSLRSLSVYGSLCYKGVLLDPRTLMSISWPTSLQDLRLQGFIIADESEAADKNGLAQRPPIGHSSLRLLLHSLPPSLQLLQLHYCDCLAARGVSLDLRLDAGRVREAELLGKQQIPNLECIATILGRGGLMPLLLEAGTQQQQQQPSDQQPQQRRLERFRIDTLAEEQEEWPLSGDAVCQLQSLRRHVVELEIGCMCTSVDAMADRVLQVLELQAAPRRFEIEFPLYGEDEGDEADPHAFELSLWNDREAPSVTGEGPLSSLAQAEASGAASGQFAPPSLPAPPQPASPPPPLPSTRELIQRMVPHMMTGPAAVAGPAAEGTQHSSLAVATGAGAAAVTTPALPAALAGFISPVLLMKGPLMAVLSQDKGLLRQWMKVVETRAAALVTGVGGDSGGRGQRCIAGYLALPPTDAVLVKCCEGTVAAVLQAATAIMQAAEGVATSTAATAAPAGATAASLQVLPVVVREVLSVFWHAEESLASFFMAVFEKVVQEAWDAATDAGGPDVLRRRQLEWLLGLRDELVLLMPLSRPLD